MLTGTLLIALLAGAQPEPSEPINAVLGDASWIARTGAPPPSSAGEVERIRVHLEHVAELLSAADVQHLSTEQRRRRAGAVEVLRTYSANGVFPRRAVGDGYGPRRPRFIDDRGVHCAVGELIRVSGHAELAREIDGRWSHAYVPDIPSEALHEWARQHGFTVLELAMIQPAYQPPRIHHKVFFPSGSQRVPKPGTMVLDEVAQIILGDPNVKRVRIEGHSDSVGPAEANQRASLRRAEAVRDYLLERGVPAERLSVKGIGETKPIADNTTPGGRSQNRRVEFVVAEVVWKGKTITQ